MNDLVLEKLANGFRSDHGFTAKEPIRLKSLLQRLKVVTVFSSLSEHFSGMVIRHQIGQDVYRFMLVNANQSLGKQHFTICHELYHLYVQTDFQSRVCHTGLFDKKDREEFNADRFASYLLLPSEGIIDAIPDAELATRKISLSTLLHIEHLYSCSRRALLYRLKKMKFIDEVQYDQWTVNIKRNAREYGYPTDLYETGNNGQVIGDYGTLARRLYDAEIISQSHYYSLLADLGIDLSKTGEGDICE